MLDDLFHVFRRKLYASAKRYKKGITSPRFDSSDIAQDGLLKLWVKYQNSGGDFEVSRSFLDQVSKGVTANTIRFHSADKRSQNSESHCYPAAAISSADNPHDVVAEAENFRRLLELLASLTPEQRRAFEMFVFNDAAYWEIAEELNITIDKVRTLIKNAKIELRKQLVQS